jgi:zinc transport system substrate-binding protein
MANANDISVDYYPIGYAILLAMSLRVLLFSFFPLFASKPLIITSTPPHEQMVLNIAGDQADVTCIVPADADPHHWEPSPQNITTCYKAKIWFQSGESFEKPLETSLKEKNPALIVVNLLETLPQEDLLKVPSEKAYDTHIWLSPLLNIKQCTTIKDTLVKNLPDTSLIEKNYLSSVSELQKLYDATKKSLAPFKDSYLLTTHNAFTYYCKDFLLHQITIEPSEGKEILPKKLTELSYDLLQKKGLVAIAIGEPNHNNRAAEHFAKQLKIPFVLIDPYKKDYIDTIHQITNAITDAPSNKI